MNYIEFIDKLKHLGVNLENLITYKITNNIYRSILELCPEATCRFYLDDIFRNLTISKSDENLMKKSPVTGKMVHVIGSSQITVILTLSGIIQNLRSYDFLDEEAIRGLSYDNVDDYIMVYDAYYGHAKDSISRINFVAHLKTITELNSGDMI